MKGKSAAEQKDMREKEVTHSRLAMIAFMGAAIQTLVFPDKLLLG